MDMPLARVLLRRRWPHEVQSIMGLMEQMKCRSPLKLGLRHHLGLPAWEVT